MTTDEVTTKKIRGTAENKVKHQVTQIVQLKITKQKAKFHCFAAHQLQFQTRRIHGHCFRGWA